MKKVTNAMNAVCGEHTFPVFIGEEDNKPYIGKAFWDSLALRNDLFKEPETFQVVHDDQRMQRTEFVLVSTPYNIVRALHNVRGYIRYFEYIKDEELDRLIEALEHYIGEDD